jgi:hypothetical protein
MANHIRAHHRNAVTESQLPLMLEACEQDQKHFPSTSCPLCESWQSVPGKETSSYLDNAHPFYRHMGHHQQLLALEALPLYIEGLEINTEDDDGDTANEDSNSEPEDSDTGDSTEILLPGLPDPIFDPIAPSGIDTDGLGEDINVLFLAASLHAFSIESTKLEFGYPYLMYQEGEVGQISHSAVTSKWSY